MRVVGENWYTFLDMPLSMRFLSRTPSITLCSSNAWTLNDLRSHDPFLPNTLSPEPLARATSASARRRLTLLHVHRRAEHHEHDGKAREETGEDGARGGSQLASCSAVGARGGVRLRLCRDGGGNGEAGELPPPPACLVRSPMPRSLTVAPPAAASPFVAGDLAR